MKKISAVLLVLVLVSSVAFAGFTGSAEANFGINLDTQEWGFANPQEWDVDLVLHEEIGEAAGEGDVYAEIKASFTFSFEADEATAPLDASVMAVEADFDYAKVVGEDWYVGILGAMAAPNFASSAIDIDNTADEDPLDLDPADTVTDGAGVEVGYSGYVFGVGATRGPLNDLDGKTHDIFGSIATPDFELGDGLTMAFGAAGLLSNGATGNAASASAKGTYTMDDVTASVAADLIYDGGLEAEVAVNAVIDPVTLDVYFATLDDAATAAYADGVDNILSAKAAFAIEQFDITVTGKDLLNASDLGVSVDFTATEEISVNVNGGYTLLGVNKADWYAGAGLTYTVEDYTAKLSGTLNKGSVLEMAASVESTTLVPGATLALAWEDADDLLDKDAAVATNLGLIKASVNIAF